MQRVTFKGAKLCVLYSIKVPSFKREVFCDMSRLYRRHTTRSQIGNNIYIEKCSSEDDFKYITSVLIFIIIYNHDLFH